MSTVKKNQKKKGNKQVKNKGKNTPIFIVEKKDNDATPINLQNEVKKTNSQNN